MKSKGKKRGFTAIELVVGASIFLLVFGGGAGSLIYTLRVQKKILKVQASSSEMDYAIEFMGRALRFAVKERREEVENRCISRNYFYDVEEHEVIFINHLQEDSCQRFWLEDETIWYNNGYNNFPLTSPHTVVNDLRFQDWGQGGVETIPGIGEVTNQPRITILIKATPEGYTEPIYLQTTVTPRFLNVRFQ